MLAAENGHKDVVLFLTQKGANLNLVNEVSVHVYMLYEKVSITEERLLILFPQRQVFDFFYHILKKIELLCTYNNCHGDYLNLYLTGY